MMRKPCPANPVWPRYQRQELRKQRKRKKKTACAKCGQWFPSLEACAEHAVECQKGWTPTLEDLCEEVKL